MDNKITVKSYLFLVFMFPLMIALAITNFLFSNILLFSLFILIALILGILLILFKPEKTIKIKYGENTLLNIG
jgi:positive regulator of sigma E activity